MVSTSVDPSGERPFTALGETADSTVLASNLTRVLAEFAERLVRGFRIQEILDHLVLRIVEVLPITGAGVALMGSSDELHFAAASNETILEIERLQNELDEGPCLEAYRSGEAVAVPDLAVDERFPRFSARAGAAGLAAVFTFPLIADGRPFGALDLYRDVAGELDPAATEAGQTLADVAAAYLHYARDRAQVADTLDLVRRQALHDPLTGLPNRALLMERLDRAVVRATRSGNLVAVLFVDLDQFKKVNDDHGHHAGDEVLTAVAERLSGMLRSGDTVARLGGDEFVLVCEGLASEDQADRIADEVTEVLAAAFDVEGRALWLTASIGSAICGPSGADPETLLREADSAMYGAKQAGRGRYRILDHRAQRAADGHGGLTRDLHEALQKGEFRLAYQPIAGVRDGALEGLEALLRWKHPLRGWVSPREMLPVVEATGLITPLGEWVLTQACRDFLHWQRDYGRAVPHVSVNVSPLQVMASGLVRTVEGVLDSTGIDPSHLALEVTESVLLDDGPRALAVLQEVHRLGVRLVLDDFGTGYSSLNYLRTFPFDVLKIDQVFTRDLATDARARTIVKAVIDLAHALDLTVVAEGVETAGQLDHLVSLGADRVQGYHLCRPLLVDELCRTVLGPGTTAPIRLPVDGDRPSSVAQVPQ